MRGERWRRAEGTGMRVSEVGTSKARVRPLRAGSRAVREATDGVAIVLRKVALDNKRG